MKRWQYKVMSRMLQVLLKLNIDGLSVGVSVGAEVGDSVGVEVSDIFWLVADGISVGTSDGAEVGVSVGASVLGGAVGRVFEQPIVQFSIDSTFSLYSAQSEEQNAADLSEQWQIAELSLDKSVPTISRTHMRASLLFPSFSTATRHRPVGDGTVLTGAGMVGGIVGAVGAPQLIHVRVSGLVMHHGWSLSTVVQLS
jgi:hypothetical protein